MTVAELIAHLQTFPPGLVVVEQRFSDLGPMDKESFTLYHIAMEVDGKYGWARRAHSEHDLKYLTPDQKSRIQECVLYWGN